jgi:hypothetical protein
VYNSFVFITIAHIIFILIIIIDKTVLIGPEHILENSARFVYSRELGHAVSTSFYFTTNFFYGTWKSFMCSNMDYQDIKFIFSSDRVIRLYPKQWVLISPPSNVAGLSWMHCNPPPYGTIAHGSLYNTPSVFDILNYITKLCRQQAEVIQNHKNENVRYIGQGEATHRKCKRLKLGGGHVYDCSSQDCHVPSK